MKGLPKARRVNSSFISSVTYVRLAPEYAWAYPRQGFVVVRFNDGSVFAYLAPAWTYGLLLAAESTGRAYHRLIKDRGLPGVKL